MKNLGVMCLAFALGLSGCATSLSDGTRSVKPIVLGAAVAFRPKRLSKGGDTANHPCLRGEYRHIYETEGRHGHEVWLCCVPLNELFSDAFNCQGGSLDIVKLLYHDEQYAKVRGCGLVHPTATELTVIPVCIEAPLTAPDAQTIR